MSLDSNISGKVVVITGASSGLGESTARHLASKGAHVVLGARREDRLKTIADEINAAGNGKAAYITTDVTSKSDVQALVDKAVSEFGKIEI